MTGDDPILTGKIALAHMKEFPVDRRVTATKPQLMACLAFRLHQLADRQHQRRGGAGHEEEGHRGGGAGEELQPAR